MNEFAKRAFIAIGFGVFLTLLGYGVDAWLARLGISAWSTIFDDVLVGTLGGFLAFTWATLLAQKELRTKEKLMLVAALNHHVRSGLEAILMAAPSADQNERLAYITDAVGRIEWSLRELVPTAFDAYGAPTEQALRGLEKVRLR